MADMNIIQQGELAKYIITSRTPNFNIEEDDFTVEIIYGMRDNKITIQKSEMTYGTDGEYVMVFSTKGMIGKLTARMTWQQHDTDINPGNQRPNVDEQVIGFVVTTPCPQFFTCPKCSSEGHDVNYEYTEDPDIEAKYVRLCVTEIITPESGGEPYTIYRPLVTRNDEYIYVLRESSGIAADLLANAIANSNN